MTKISQYFRSDFQELARLYAERKPRYEEFVQKADLRLREIFRHPKVELYGIDHRIKSLESFLEKCMRKSVNNPFNDIIDLVGFRIIFLYSEHLEAIEQIIRDHFQVLARFDKKQEYGYKVFAYDAVHYHLLFEGQAFELQLRTLIQHTWAVLDQRLFYKTQDRVPHQIRRKMNRLAALFELAEEEYRRMREECRDFIEEYSLAKSDTLAPLPLDLMSLEAYHRTCFSTHDFVRENVDLTIKLLHNYGVRTIGDLREAMRESEELRKRKSEEMAEYANFFDFHLFIVISMLKQRDEVREKPTTEIDG